ncbi:hypothetical protein CNR37_00044 [Pseudomonas phage ventosus]|uniref:Uncharacterized protein n=1 Tax=Pseudomonas phage ventosus TaxID=2048980 RepID=A0A2H4P7W7_9CAUD|nr:hypothetical protein CNR37_00044 [Pseudomonas phage ventosus]
MSIVVNEAVQKEPEHTFEPNSLYKSVEFGRNGNLYLIIGDGECERTVEALRIAGSNAPHHSRGFLRHCMTPFEGEVVIKND